MLCPPGSFAEVPEGLSCPGRRLLTGSRRVPLLCPREGAQVTAYSHRDTCSQHGTCQARLCSLLVLILKVGSGQTTD